MTRMDGNCSFLVFLKQIRYEFVCLFVMECEYGADVTSQICNEKLRFFFHLGIGGSSSTRTRCRLEGVK